MEKEYAEAESLLAGALKEAPEDYAGLLLMAKCCMAQNKTREARRHIEKAQAVYPEEAQADHLGGMVSLSLKAYDAALADFTAYEQKLPGNLNTVFFKGYCFEGMGRRKEAAAHYVTYARQVSSGEYAGHARTRLVEWGVVAPSK
jgi:thioredoxin-like negative regulator of GroEL